MLEEGLKGNCCLFGQLGPPLREPNQLSLVLALIVAVSFLKIGGINPTTVFLRRSYENLLFHETDPAVIISRLDYCTNTRAIKHLQPRTTL